MNEILIYPQKRKIKFTKIGEKKLKNIKAETATE